MPEHAEAAESICEPGPLIDLGGVAVASPARQSPQEEGRARREEARGHGVSEQSVPVLPSPRLTLFYFPSPQLQ
jgi:hypothetical protein